MKIVYDPAKRAATLAQRGLDFADAAKVFARPIVEFEDRRAEYGEVRIITVGRLGERMVILGWTPRGDARHVFTMRKANLREQRRYADQSR